MITLEEIERLSKLSDRDFLKHIETGRKKMLEEGRKPTNEPSLIIDMSVEEFCKKTGAKTFEQFKDYISKTFFKQ